MSLLFTVNDSVAAFWTSISSVSKWRRARCARWTRSSELLISEYLRADTSKPPPRNVSHTDNPSAAPSFSSAASSARFALLPASQASSISRSIERSLTLSSAIFCNVPFAIVSLNRIHVSFSFRKSAHSSSI